MNLLRAVLITCVLALCVSIAYAQEEPQKGTDVSVTTARAALEGFGDLVEQALSDFNAPGAAIAIVAGDDRNGTWNARG